MLEIHENARFKFDVQTHQKHFLKAVHSFFNYNGFERSFIAQICGLAEGAHLHDGSIHILTHGNDYLGIKIGDNAREGFKILIAKEGYSLKKLYKESLQPHLVDATTNKPVHQESKSHIFTDALNSLWESQASAISRYSWNDLESFRTCIEEWIKEVKGLVKTTDQSPSEISNIPTYRSP